MNIFLVPHGPQADEELGHHFTQLAGGEGHAGSINILGRDIAAHRIASGAIWFDFTQLCGGPRSQNDYLEIAREYHTVVLSNIPQMSRNEANEARRFTWLVDVLYDQRVKFIASAAVDAAQLYREGPNAQEFPRTVSRLIEMRTREYLAEAHRPQ